jgi:hypothetical protein
LVRLSVLDEMRECWPKWSVYATLLPRQPFELGRDTPLSDGLRSTILSVAARVDADADGVVTPAELAGWADTHKLAEDQFGFLDHGIFESASYRSAASGWYRDGVGDSNGKGGRGVGANGGVGEPPDSHESEPVGEGGFATTGVKAVLADIGTRLVEDWVSYHDINGDGIVTTAEVDTNIRAWLDADVTGWPAREVGRQHRDYSEEISSCGFVDMVPTWVSVGQQPFPRCIQ